MFIHPPFRKIYPVVASRAAMYALANRHNQAPFDDDRISAAIYAGEWFEIAQPQYDEMLNLLPPLFVRPDMFAMSTYKGGNVTSTFVTITISGHPRYFRGFCDLSIAGSAEMLRNAIIARETGPHPERLSRDEQLEVIWNATPQDVRGYTTVPKPNLRSPRHRDRRSLVINDGDAGSKICLLETLTAEEIEAWLPADPGYISAIGGTGRLPVADAGDDLER